MQGLKQALAVACHFFNVCLLMWPPQLNNFLVFHLLVAARYFLGIYVPRAKFIFHVP